MNKLAALVTISLFTAMAPAFAVETNVGDAPKGGLPQFDPTWFVSQLFWLAIAFGVLYVVFAKKTLPNISSVIENRKNHIQSDLETAEKLTAEADEVQEINQKNLTTAQNDAVSAIKVVEDKSKAKADKALAVFKEQADASIEQAENNIELSKNAAMQDMNNIAIEAATQAVEKIIGVSPKDGDVQAIINNMNGKARAA